MTDPIKAKIQELCPDVKSVTPVCGNKECDCAPYFDITLAVVLRAIQKTDYQSFLNLILESDKITLESRSKMVDWNLEHDNYDAQSQETKDFIGSLLLTHEA